MSENAQMFDELVKIMHEDMAPTLGCTGPISFIYTSAVAREVVGGNNIKHIKCVANGKFCARMGEVVTPGLPEDNLEIACAIGAVAGDSSKLYEVIKDKTPEQVERAQELSKTSVEVIPDWDAKDLVYVDVSVETENGVGRCVVSGTMRNIILKERNGEVIFKSDYVPGQKKPGVSLRFPNIPSQICILSARRSPSRNWRSFGNLWMPTKKLVGMAWNTNAA